MSFTSEGMAFVPRSTYRNLHATPEAIVQGMIADGDTNKLVSQDKVVNDLLDIRNAHPHLSNLVDVELDEIKFLSVVKGERLAQMGRSLAVFMVL